MGGKEEKDSVQPVVQTNLADVHVVSFAVKLRTEQCCGPSKARPRSSKGPYRCTTNSKQLQQSRIKRPPCNQHQCKNYTFCPWTLYNIIHIYINKKYIYLQKKGNNNNKFIIHTKRRKSSVFGSRSRRRKSTIKKITEKKVL